ncbi:hypothetical protein HQ520_17455, partial [bacterium]|nr:hypothetical protein [bacterium]
MGLEGSRWKKGETYSVAWRLLAYPGDWRETLEYTSGRIMGVKDYRRPVRMSLTNAVLNMIDLMNDDHAGGWDTDLKGFYDIETPGMAKQAAPLAVLEAAILTRDQSLFERRALPTIEFTLSRHASSIVTGEKGQMTVPSVFYGSSYWQGVHSLLGELNPWLEEFILPKGAPYTNTSFNTAPAWTERLAVWRYRHDAEDLQKAEDEADAYVREKIFGRQTVPVDFKSFYNFLSIPTWWHLVDLYEATGERRYLDAAEEGAFHSIAGQWSFPPIPDGMVTIQRQEDLAPIDMKYDVENYRAGKPFRLGYPRQKGNPPETRVPAWEVSAVGLSLENTWTHFPSSGHMSYIRMLNWTPYLVRLYGHTGRDIYLSYARNGVIGRMANYPGYTAKCYTNLDQNPRYPYVGPDLTQLFCHHIAPQLAFTIDFLVAQAEQRSGGRVHFPYSVQKNYAWFANHIYGMEKGSIFGEPDARLWLDRNLVKLNTPDVDWLAARGPNRFWLILMSQSDQPLEVTPELNSDQIGIEAGKPWRRYTNVDDRSAQMDTGTRVSIPPKGLVALSIPTSRDDVFRDLPRLKEGHMKEALLEPWNDLHAFRIRSPFGKDRLYVVSTADPIDGGRMTLEVAGSEALTDDLFPYEISFTSIEPGSPAAITVRLENPDAEAQIVRFSLDGR